MADTYDKNDQTPSGWAKKWAAEIGYAKTKFDEFHTKGEAVDSAFKDDRKKSEQTGSRLNLFNANTVTLSSMLYGKTPKVDVDRTYADAMDDIARVSGEMLTRILNADIEEEGENYSEVMRNCLQDRLLPGLCAARVRYDADLKTENIPAITGGDGTVLAPAITRDVVTDEWTDTIYVHWKDVLWSPCRYWSEVRWVAFRSYLTEEQLIKRFKSAEMTEEILKTVPMNSKSPLDPAGSKSEIWCKAEVWEIWDKETKKVDWWVEGYDKTLDHKDPPTKHAAFFPMPRPMMANCTTTELIPLPDYYLAQDLYIEIDELQARISSLTEACKLVGVYDKKSEGLKRMLSEGCENELIPVDNWAAFAEKGGLKGVVDWLPLDMVVKAIDVLTVKQGEKISQLYQVTGMSDILRGAGDPRASATQEGLKAKFASVRIQALQDEFARFASDVQKLKYEIIVNHFSPETIVKASNILNTPDAQFSQPAVELIKNPEQAMWRITIAPESLAMVDFAQLQQERSAYLTALATFLQSAYPVAEKFPESAPAMIELLKWGLAGFKGSRQIEGVLDKAVAGILQSQTKGAKKPDPEQQKMQAEMKMRQAESQQKIQQSQQKHQFDMQALLLKFKLEMKKLMAEIKSDQERMAMEQQMAMFTNEMDTAAAVRDDQMAERSAEREEEAAEREAEEPDDES